MIEDASLTGWAQPWRGGDWERSKLTSVPGTCVFAIVCTTRVLFCFEGREETCDKGLGNQMQSVPLSGVISVTRAPHPEEAECESQRAGATASLCRPKRVLWGESQQPRTVNGAAHQRRRVPGLRHPVPEPKGSRLLLTRWFPPEMTASPG